MEANGWVAPPLPVASHFSTEWDESMLFIVTKRRGVSRLDCSGIDIASILGRS